MNVIQIGSNKGNDDLTKLIFPYKSLINKLILIEPLSVHHHSLTECYKDYPYIIEQIAITPNNNLKSLSFYYNIHDGPGYEVASLSKEHILKHVVFNPKLTEDGIKEEIVPCMTINQLCEKHNIKDIDILFIDAEGFDDVIIKSIDFEKLNIINLIYENLHINNNEIIVYLNSKNYDVQSNWGSNGWSSLAVKK